MNILHSRIQNFQPLVRSLIYTHDGWIVGGAAKFIVGLTDEDPRDIDILIPFYEWGKASRIIPRGSPANSFGGFKVKCGDVDVDVWAGDIGWFMCHTSLIDDIALNVNSRTILTRSQANIIK